MEKVLLYNFFILNFSISLRQVQFCLIFVLIFQIQFYIVQCKNFLFILLGFVASNWDNISCLRDHVYCFYCKSIKNAQTYQQKQMLHLQKMSSLFKCFIQLSSYVQHKNWIVFTNICKKKVVLKMIIYSKCNIGMRSYVWILFKQDIVYRGYSNLNRAFCIIL